VAGRCVRTLHDGEMQTGEHLLTWDARDNYGRNVAAGVYFGHASTPSGSTSKKIVIVR
jgi:flagellar hook assembly protein FlgD